MSNNYYDDYFTDEEDDLTENEDEYSEIDDDDTLCGFDLSCSECNVNEEYEGCCPLRR